MDLVSTGPGESFGPGSFLHSGVAAAEFGADMGGEQWDFAEERVQDGEAAADDGEVNFDGPVVNEFDEILHSEKGQQCRRTSIFWTRQFATRDHGLMDGTTYTVLRWRWHRCCP